MKLPHDNRITIKEREVMEEYLEFVNNEKGELLRIFNYLNSRSGHFYMSIINGEPVLDTGKGSDYQAENENIKVLISIMKKYKLNRIVQEGSDEDIILIRTVNENGTFVMHRLIYHKGKLDPKTQRDYLKIADDFYYSFSTGE